jgi:ATP-dependent Lon protease
VLPLRIYRRFPAHDRPAFRWTRKTIKALEEVMRSDTFILLATQKNASDDDPATGSIYEVGTLASVLQRSSCPTAPSRCWSRRRARRFSITPTAPSITKPTRRALDCPASR